VEQGTKIEAVDGEVVVDRSWVGLDVARKGKEKCNNRKRTGFERC